MASARAWCERAVARAALGTTVLEIQVFEESWSHAKSWETTPHHPVAESLQLGVVSAEGWRPLGHPALDEPARRLPPPDLIEAPVPASCTMGG